MLAQKERISPARLLLRRIILLALITVCIFGFFGVWNAYTKQQESLRLKNEALLRLTALQKRQDALNADITLLGTDRGREGVLRNQYALGKGGEEMMIIVDGPTPVEPIATSTSIKSWFKKTFLWW